MARHRAANGAGVGLARQRRQPDGTEHPGDRRVGRCSSGSRSAGPAQQMRIGVASQQHPMQGRASAAPGQGSSRCKPSGRGRGAGRRSPHGATGGETARPLRACWQPCNLHPAAQPFLRGHRTASSSSHKGTLGGGLIEYTFVRAASPAVPEDHSGSTSATGCPAAGTHTLNTEPLPTCDLRLTTSSKPARAAVDR